MFNRSWLNYIRVNGKQWHPRHDHLFVDLSQSADSFTALRVLISSASYNWADLKKNIPNRMNRRNDENKPLEPQTRNDKRTYGRSKTLEFEVRKVAATNRRKLRLLFLSFWGLLVQLVICIFNFSLFELLKSRWLISEPWSEKKNQNTQQLVTINWPKVSWQFGEPQKRISLVIKSSNWFLLNFELHN